MYKGQRSSKACHVGVGARRSQCLETYGVGVVADFFACRV